MCKTRIQALIIQTHIKMNGYISTESNSAIFNWAPSSMGETKGVGSTLQWKSCSCGRKVFPSREDPFLEEFHYPEKQTGIHTFVVAIRKNGNSIKREAFQYNTVLFIWHAKRSSESKEHIRETNIAVSIKLGLFQCRRYCLIMHEWLWNIVIIFNHFQNDFKTK